MDSGYFFAMQKTDYFIELYTTAKRVFYNIPFIKAPEFGSKDYLTLDEVRKKIDDLSGDYADFIRCQMYAFKVIHIFPKPHHLNTEKAFARYKRHQAMKRIYRTPIYTIDGDTFTVVLTWKSYPMSQVQASISNDSTANYATYTSRMRDLDNVPLEGTLFDAVEYTLAKLDYLKKQPTESLLRLQSRLKKGA